MRHFAGQGVRTFDMGIGDYAFKRGFGAQTQPLFDLVVPLTLKALPAAALFRAKGALRRNPRFKALADRLRGGAALIRRRGRTLE